MDPLGPRLVAGVDEGDGVEPVVLELGVGRGRPDRLVVDVHLGVGDVRLDDEPAVDPAAPAGRQAGRDYGPTNCPRGRHPGPSALAAASVLQLTGRPHTARARPGQHDLPGGPAK